jgi:hypothetical protein
MDYGAAASSGPPPARPIETEDDVSDKGTIPDPDDPPAVLSPGDSDAPDAPDEETIYPHEQGRPGEREE